MATLEKIRQRGVLIAVVIGLALFAFIIGDFINSRGSLFSNNQFEIAEVAGTSIAIQEYQAEVDYMTEINKLFTGNGNMDEATRDRIMEQTWQQLVQKYVLKDEYKKLGIDVHADEVKDMVVGNNIHPIVQQIFTDPNTGTVNIAQLTNFVQNLDQDQSGRSRMYWMYIEKEIIRERKYSKYNNLIQKGLYATSAQAKNATTEKGRTVSLEYIVQKYNTVSDSLIQFTNADLQKYYDEHKNEYKQENTRSIAYVSFDVVPSEDDYEDAKIWIEDIKNDFANTADAIQFVNLNSDVPHNNMKYKSSELDASVKEFALKAKIGDITDPIFENDQYKLIKLADIVYSPDSVQARHILIQPEGQTNGDYTAAKSLADSLLTVAKRGANFANLARNYSKDQGSADKGGDLGWFPEGVMVQPFTDACFNGSKGDIVMVETQFGFHIINITNQSRKEKRYILTNLVKNVVPSTKTFQYYYAEASKFAGMNRTEELFNKAVTENASITKKYANNLNENQKYITGLTSPRPIIRWAFESELGDVSEVYDMGEGNAYIVAMVTDVKEKGIAPLEDVKAQVILNVKKEKKAELMKKQLSDILAGSNFDQIANEKNLVIEEASNISFNSFAMATAGIEPKVIGSAAVGTEGMVYGPIEGNNGVYLIRITEVTEAGETDITLEQDQLNRAYANREIYEAYEALKDISKVEDSRSKFY